MTKRAVVWLFAAGLLVSILAAVSLAFGKKADDSARVEKICAAYGGHWERTGIGGACIDTREDAS